MLEQLELEDQETEMPVDTGYVEGTRKQPRAPRHVSHLAPPPTSTETPSSTGWEVLQDLTPEEAVMIAKRRSKAAAAKSKRDTTKALTGEAADYPSLSHVWSGEVALNMVFSMAARMRVFLWKKLLWQLRVKSAVEKMTGARWKRNPRWLAMLLSKEAGALYGHFGALRQRLNARDILHLM